MTENEAEALEHVLIEAETEYTWLERTDPSAEALRWLGGVIANLRTRVAGMRERAWQEWWQWAGE